MAAVLAALSPLNACEAGADEPRPPEADPPAAARDAGVQIPDERELFLNAARTAWSFVDRNYQPRTGLVKAHDTYQYVTVWDIGSILNAYHSAQALGIIDEADFERRTQAALATLGQMSLFEGTAYNKLYDATTGRSVDRNQRPSERGYGWSVLDLGRLLISLKIISTNHPQFADEIQAIVDRMDLGKLVRDGYLMGRDLNPETAEPRSYQEGKIGYEQYAAEGFALWGHRAEKALSFRENVKPIEVHGVPLYADTRGDDHLTSEAFIMMGLELGWRSPEWREMAWRVLAAQEARYEETGEITMVSEDALPVPPHYFYYYTVYHDGTPFAIKAPGADGVLDAPRWISTKAAFGWHALLPNPYTWQALQAVAPAAEPRSGWSAGVYEGSRRSTGSQNMNTASIVLESALYYLNGRPLMDF